MDKNVVLQVLNDWNPWGKPLDTGILRESYILKYKNLLSSSHIISIIGPRRSGKSVLMKQMADSLIKNQSDKRDILIINFEDPRLIEINPQSLDELFNYYLEYIRPLGKPYIFLDEIQEIKNWEKWVRMIHETNKAKICISGSNASLLNKELGTLLTGRHVDISIFPLSFNEYTLFNQQINTQTTKSNNLLIEEILEYGSFPELFIAIEKKQLLLQYFNDIIQKDIIRRYQIRKSAEISRLANFLMTNISSLITYNSLEKYLNISASTIEKFSKYLEDAYLLFFVKRFSFKVKEQEKSPRKVYAVDTGLANAIGFRFVENKGHCAENFVFLELLKQKNTIPDREIYYWKDEQHKEVDFIVKDGIEITQVIQVCWNVNHPETRKREITSLVKALIELNKPEGLVITYDYEFVEQIQGKTIKFVTLSNWLSQNLIN